MIGFTTKKSDDMENGDVVWGQSSIGLLNFPVSGKVETTSEISACIYIYIFIYLLIYIYIDRGQGNLPERNQANDSEIRTRDHGFLQVIEPAAPHHGWTEQSLPAGWPEQPCPREQGQGHSLALNRQNHSPVASL